MTGGVEPTGRLTGKLSSSGGLKGSLSDKASLKGTISMGGSHGPPVYDGPTEVEPLFTQQVLLTANKRMEEDVTVNAIKVSYVSNPQGGTTAYIGGEFYHV